MNKPASKPATRAQGASSNSKAKRPASHLDEMSLRVQVAELRLRFEKLLADLVALQQGGSSMGAQKVEFGSDGPKEKNF